MSGMLRLLNASWPLFRAFRVRVRVHWSIAIVPVAFFAGFAKWLPADQAALWAAAWTFALYLVVWTHEMGHVTAGRRVGVDTGLITLSPLGGLAHMDQGAPSPRSEVFISLAGPATHLLWLAAAWLPWRLLELDQVPDVWAWMLQGFIGLQVALIAFNLLPFFPMDGGRVFRALLSMRMHPNRASTWAAWVGLGGAIAMGLAGLTIWILGEAMLLHGDVYGPILLMVAVNNFLACRRLQMEARWGEGPYEKVESWKLGREVESWRPSPEDERLARAEERRERRAAQERRKEELRRERLQQRIDELLDRINEVGGVEHLTTAERRELADASELLRRETTA